MNDARDARAIRDWQLDRLRLDELPPDETAALREALALDESLQRRLERLDADSRAILDELPPRVVAAAVRARHDAGKASAAALAGGWRPTLAVGAAMLLAVGFVALLGPFPELATPRTAVTDTTRLKGLRPEVRLFRKTPTGAESLSPGSVGRRGDVIQLVYQAAGRRYGAIVSVDGRGVVTAHLPAQGSRAAALEIGSAAALPVAYLLDDAPRWEAFYFVTAPEDFDLRPVLEAARLAAASAKPAAPLLLPAGLEQSAFLLKKDDTR
jgi:hypothetical protein